MRSLRDTLILLLLVVAAAAALAGSTIHESNKYAWAESPGWINLRADVSNGVVVGEFVCSGYMWSESTAWIHWGDGTPTNGVRYGNDSSEDYGVNHNGAGDLRGYAWCAGVGWITFEDSGAPTVDLKTGIVSGHAWGGSLGWITFSNIQAYTESVYMTNGPDANGNKIPDGWEIEQAGSTNVLTSTNDYDGDGMLDPDEYAAGTDPTNANSYLYVDDVSLVTGTTFQLSWPCEYTRVYRVQSTTDLMDTSSWANVNLGLLSTNEGSNIVIELPAATATQEFYRIKVMLPLSE